MPPTKSYLKDLVYLVNGAAIEVHRALGPGLLESVYHRCMVKELEMRDVRFVSEIAVPVSYKGVTVETDLRWDLFVENVLAVELKSVNSILPVHEAQLLTYMRLLGAPMGLLINFNVTNIFREGQKTFVTESYRKLN